MAQKLSSITKKPMGIYAPLSLAQRRLWILYHLDPQSSEYNISRAWRLKGSLNTQALVASLNLILARHETLRTTFQEIHGQPIQVIQPTLTAPFHERDCSSYSPSQLETEIDRFLTEEPLQPFDLLTGPLVRFTLIRCSPDDHVLVFTVHHMVFDGTSLKNFCKELSRCYAATLAEQPSPLAPLPIQYEDFSYWQQAHITNGKLASQLAFWTQQLQEAPLVLELPSDFSRPKENTGQGNFQVFTLSHQVISKLKQLIQPQGITVFMALLAVFQILLTRYTGQRDILIGTPIAGRTHTDLENLIGFLVNTLVLRTQFRGSSTFHEVLRQVRKTCLEAYRHQDLPFEKLVEVLNPVRDPSRYPVVQAIFQLRQRSDLCLTFPEILAHPFPVKKRTGNFDLHMVCEETESGIQGFLYYSKDLFSATQMACFAEHYQLLLGELLANPHRPIWQIPFLTEAECHKQLVEWNDTATAYPQDACIHELFERQVTRTPQAVAVVFGEEQLTYSELNVRANQLAQYLQQHHGVGPEVCVGLCMERTLDMMVGILGILKAGGAYVPMDLELPDQRLALIVEDAQIRHVVTQQSLAHRFSAVSVDLICVDCISELNSIGSSTDGSKRRATNPTKPHHLAYIIYTSGSSGRPKGVAVEHRHLVNYVLGVVDRLKFDCGWTYATVTTVAADLGNTMIFPALCVGGCLHVLSKDHASDSKLLADYISRNPIDCLKITPSHLAALIDGPSSEQILPRKRLVLGGESLHRDLVNRIGQLKPMCRIFNHYGPSEATIGVSTFEVGETPPHTASGTVSIGRPLPNSKIYILDNHMEPVPIGVAGQLCIGGASVARGYLNRPQLTDERFVPDPLVNDDHNARLYQTGDVARFLADGNIEFLGRSDQQVKVRGYRVEPGEIEATIKAHPSVIDAAVIVHPDPTGGHQLSAFVVPQGFKKEFSKKRTHKLPNNLVVAHLNNAETDYLYREIFQLQAYLKHGVTIEDGDCVFDVGANIGLFSMFVSQLCHHARVYAFEPNPTVFEILQANATVHCHDMKTWNVGLGRETKTAELTFFEGFSLFSGYYADAEQEKSVVKTYMANQKNQGLAEMDNLLSHADDLLDDRFETQSLATRLRRLSEIIEEEGIDRIDLLKINVEKSELDVLQGIDEEDWCKIRQIVLEVDVEANLPTITGMLQRHGFDFMVGRDEMLEETELCYVYATRPGDGRKLLRNQSADAHLRDLPASRDTAPTPREIHEYLSQQLPPYMVPSSIVLLDALPLTTNGKLDRGGLESFANDQGGSDYTYVAPRTSTEKELASIWKDLLMVQRIGIREDFFELGGHSLLVTRVNARIASVFQVDLPLRKLFEAPTIAELAGEIETLRSGGRAPIRALKRVDREQLDRLPLSFAQQRLWFLEQMEGELTAYNMAFAWRLRGTLHREAFRRALEAIVRRHETLRTTFAMIDEKPVQVIGTIERFELPFEDFSGFATDQQAEQIAERCGKEAVLPFDLTSDLMLRAVLLRLAEDEHVLLLTIHHIASDGWSLRVLWHELELLYDAFRRNVDPDLPELSVQYADYAVWQQSELQGPRLEQLQKYWRGQLADPPHQLELPTDFPRPPVQTHRGAHHIVQLPESVVSTLKALSQAEGITMFMSLLTAFVLVLSRHSNQEDLLVGTPVANRPRPELEEMIGLFLNTLVLRTNLSGDPTLRELLRRVREVCLEAYAHQELPFERLVEELRPERDLSRTPLFQVFFNFVDISEMALTLPGLTVSSLERAGETTKFDLTLYVFLADTSATVQWRYNSDLFDGETITRFGAHFHKVLTEVVRDPAQRLSQISLLEETERQQLLDEWNATETAYPREATIAERFEAQVAATPDSVALIFGEDTLSYDQLNTRGNHLAQHLQQQYNVGPEVCVGLCMERSLEMIVALLGILKAGGAYVPLDPSAPPERLAFMAKDAALRVILTQEKFQEHLSQLGAEHIRLDVDWPVIGQEEESTPVSEARADSLAYVIYTSGSTGRPKGVEVEHRQVLNYVDGILERLKLPAGSSFAMVSPLTADLGNTMLYPALTTGGTLHIISEDRATDPEALGAYFQHHRPDCLKIVPSHLATLLMGAAPAKVLPQKRLVVGGESCPWHLVEKVQALRPGCGVINHYGPTETTVGVTTHQVEGTKRTSSDSPGVPIGRPLANSQLYLLDKHKNPVPLGVAGEVYIGGRGLARGYVDAPELTAEKFLPHPYSEEPGARLYKTGDRAKFQPDGTIEFLGRIDDQVKLRGFRIELGEIESVLAAHLQVPVAVGLYGDETGGTQRLVAYIGGEGRALPSVEEVKVFLKTTLPDYMIPANLVVLESLPVLPNGKVNRHALPDPERVTDWKTEFVAPRNLTEEIIASIWADVLQRERVSLHDNFFDLGGHSLLATQVVLRMRDAFGVNMKLGYFFEMPTIAGMAEFIETLQWKTKAPLRVGETSSPDRKRGRL